eukprot:TRINITY_DN1609_c0_g1_i5.p1 TRINITY_DN1609_c0_g1~~TRINITY_DN1609_c0_g1_i5.p1  ORF type:complete len:210 (+),score=44.54 TRINITY_DN1609_c0_g1_i5:30-632(+)
MSGTEEKKKKKVLVAAADGSEEIETVCIVDVLRRAGADVTLASAEHSTTLSMSRHVKIVADTLLSSIPEDEYYDMIAIPGGMPGSQRLGENEQLKRRVVAAAANPNVVVAAVCAAPARTLGAWGLLVNKNATSHPSHQSMLPTPRDPHFDRSARVVVDGNIITSQGPGTSLEFALELVRALYGAELATQLAAQMVLHSSK